MSRELIWIQRDAYHLVSEPPGFTISRATLDDGVCYIAWRLSMTRTEQSKIIAVRHAECAGVDTKKIALDACKLACQEYKK